MSNPFNNSPDPAAFDDQDVFSFGDPVIENNPSQENTAQAPKKKPLGVLIVGAVVLLALVGVFLLFGGSVKVGEKGTATKETTQGVVTEESSGGTKQGSTSGTKDSTQSTGTVQGSTKPETATTGTTEETQQSDVLSNTNKDGVLNESQVTKDLVGTRVEDPNVSERYSATGIVTDKYVVQSASGQYIYVVQLRVTSKSGGNATLTYYPVADAYSRLGLGSQVNVKYSGTSAANLAVLSVSLP